MDVVTHKCPNCGGPLLFDPDTQKFECEYCLSIFTEQQLEEIELKEQAAEVSGDSSSDVALDLFSCPNCGAEIVTDATTAATFCYYCHNPVVLTKRLSGDLLPDRILPFAIDKQQATDNFLKWTKSKFFIPKDFFSSQQIEKLTGVYFPYWLVDADLKGRLRAKSKNISVWRIGDIEYTKTDTYKLEREGSLHFEDYVRNALKKNDTQTMVESVQPFPLDTATEFNSGYLSGFQAERRDIEFNEIQESVNSSLQHYSDQLLSQSANALGVLYDKKVQTNIQTQSNHYVLLPVWLLTYRSSTGKDKVYYYAMNGKTGKVSGRLPIDKVKLALVSSGAGILVLLLALLVGYFI